MLKSLSLSVPALLIAGGLAFAADESSLATTNRWLVSDLYKAPVYDMNNNKIGQVDNLILELRRPDQDGRHRRRRISRRRLEGCRRSLQRAEGRLARRQGRADRRSHQGSAEAGAGLEEGSRTPAEPGVLSKRCRRCVKS